MLAALPYRCVLQSKGQLRKLSDEAADFGTEHAGSHVCALESVLLHLRHLLVQWHQGLHVQVIRVANELLQLASFVLAVRPSWLMLLCLNLALVISCVHLSVVVLLAVLSKLAYSGGFAC